MMRRIVVLLSLLLLPGCGAPDGPNVSLSQLATYKLQAVEIGGEGVVRSWPAVERAFLASGHADPGLADRLSTEAASNFPPLRAEIKQALERRFLVALRRDGGVLFAGVRPIVANITVLAFDVPSTGRQLLASGTAVANFKIDLVDPATRDVLVSYPGQFTAVGRMGGAIGVIASSMDDKDVGEELIEKAAVDYLEWLRKPNARS